MLWANLEYAEKLNRGSVPLFWRKLRRLLAYKKMGSASINVLPAIKDVPEVCHIICASANPVQVIVAETEQGCGILGVIDGYSPKGIETETDIEDRKNFLRTIGYKL